MAAKVLARYKNKENSSSIALFTPVEKAFTYYDKMVSALTEERNSQELPKKVEHNFREPVERMKNQVALAEKTIKEMLLLDKATPRIDVKRSLTETADRIKTAYDQYDQEFQETLHLAKTAHMLNHDGSIVNPQSLRIYRAAFLMVSVVSVATIVAGLIFGFILGVSNYRSYVRPTQRNTACNMGGIVLISNAGLMWATCAFVPLLLTFCFPLAAVLEAYVCQPYDEHDGSSLDGAASYLFNIPKVKLFRYFTPSNILGKCTGKTAYASIANLSLSPLEELNAQHFRKQLFGDWQSSQEYVKNDTLDVINKCAKKIIDSLKNDNMLQQLKLSTASKAFDRFLDSVKTANDSASKLLASKGSTSDVDVAIAQELNQFLNDSLWKAEEIRRQAKDSLKNNVGDCTAARRVASIGFLVACRIVSDNMNGLWLSLVCCLLSMCAAIPVTLMISRYFLRMRHYLVDGQPADEDVRGEQEARIKQEKHLKRIKEVREHLLQQSRDARCLVMSFDTLDAPSALPAVSADSGSSQLARIIPTSVVRRVGVDDPKVPRGKESPFRRVVTLKPAVPRAAVRPLRSALQMSGFMSPEVANAGSAEDESASRGHALRL
ncbi:uncharacterized protein LOC144094553 [Amblyomma americanum]